MGRLVALAISLFACTLLGACAQGGVAVPAKPERTPTAAPTPTATLGPTPGLVLLDISGSGSHQSNKFTAIGSWDISWQAQADPNTTGSFIAINIYDPEGKPVAATINADLDAGATKSDVVHMHYAGTVYLDISAVSTWHIKAMTT